jgi:hypothetical protein
VAIGYVNKSSTVNSTSGTTTVVATPAGTLNGHRLVAFVGTVGASATLTDPDGATWVKLGEYAPNTNLKTAVYYRNATGAEAANYTWTWSASGRNFGHIVAYSGVDLTVPPSFAVGSGAADSAGPHTAPGVTVADQGWLITAVGARQSPGTAGQVSWTSSDGVDVERYDVTATNTGTGGQLPTALYDTGRPLSSAGGTSVPIGAAPVNAYNSIYAGRGAMLIGQTNAANYNAEWANRLLGVDWMRIFPNSSGLPPAWDDSRVAFIEAYGGSPFLSTKCDGDPAKIAEVMAHLEDMPAWITGVPGRYVWITDRHEPEGDIPAATYIDNIKTFITAVNALSAPIRAKVKVGPVLTRQWTENTAGRSYATHDPGSAWGDFFGVDMYANSWQPLPDPAAFTAGVKAYRYDAGDTRPRCFPELGAIGYPTDTTGSARAAWMQGLQAELASWTQADQGWPFAGWCWWNEEGKSGGATAGLGTHRWFQLDRRHNSQPYDGDPEGGWEYLPVQGSGTVPTPRKLTAAVTVGLAHLWAVGLKPLDASVPNAWTSCGVPIR